MSNFNFNSFRSVLFSCLVCKTQNSEILPELSEKSSEECAEAKKLASQIQFKNSKTVQEPEPEQKQSTSDDSESSGLIRRNVENQSSDNLENIVNRRVAYWINFRN